MSFNISTFISNLQYDGLRTNLFEIQLIGPFGPIQQFTFRAKGTQIPASQIATASIFYYGREVKVAGNRDFDTWTCTVFMDEDDYLITRDYLERWSWNINQHQNNVRTPGYGSPTSYFGSAIITHFTKEGPTPVGTYQMLGCFPIDVGEITLDWGDVNRIAEFQVTFAYQWWQSIASLPEEL